MLELEENLRVLKELLEKLNSLEEALNISSLKKKLEENRKLSEEDGFWKNQEASSKVFAEIKQLERKIESFEIIQKSLNDLMQMNELLQTEYDEELGKDLIVQTTSLEKKIENLELETLLSGKYDSNDAILTLHPGARWNRISRLGANAI